MRVPEQWEGNFLCDNHYEIKIDLQSKYFPNINQFRVFKRVPYLSRDNLYEISKSSPNNIPIGYWSRNGEQSLHILHKIANVSPVTFISQKEQKKGEEKRSTS